VVCFPRVVRKLNVLGSTSPNQGLQQQDQGSPDELGVKPGFVRIVSLGNCFSNLSYYMQLTRHPGPLVNSSSKEAAVRWAEEYASGRIDTGEVPNPSHPDAARVLWGLIRIMLLHYGALISDDPTKANSPESAIRSLLLENVAGDSWRTSAQPVMVASARRSDSETQVAAAEMQRLLLQGKRSEACRVAMDGDLWAPALLLASFIDLPSYQQIQSLYAQRAFADGSPLRTLFLSFSGRVEDLFQGLQGSGQGGSQYPFQQSMASQEGQRHALLDQWQENLCMMLANRTANDKANMLRMGDALWSVHSSVEAAHVCYLAAEQYLEPDLPNSRMVLIGASHRAHRRQFISAEALQRTEMYELSRTLGNSQFSLPVFQPYKFIYACMLAEVGQSHDALKYCEAIMLVVNKRSADFHYSPVFTAQLQDLEHRLKHHLGAQKGGGTGSLWGLGKALGGLVSRLTGSSSSAGAGAGAGAGAPTTGITGNTPPASVSFETRTITPANTLPPQLISSSQSYPSLSTLNQGLNSAQGNSPPLASSAGAQPMGKGRVGELINSDSSNQPQSPSGSSTLSKLGSGLGWSLRGIFATKSVEAKLGEENKYFYDQNLKRWVREGETPQVEEQAPTAPPTDTDLGGPRPGPFPPSQQPLHDGYGAPSSLSGGGGGAPSGNDALFSAQQGANRYARKPTTGVRSRYVDTLNSSVPSGPAPPEHVQPGLAMAQPRRSVPSNVQIFQPRVPPAQSTAEPTAEASSPWHVSSPYHPPEGNSAPIPSWNPDPSYDVSQAQPPPPETQPWFSNSQPSSY